MSAQPAPGGSLVPATESRDRGAWPVPAVLRRPFPERPTERTSERTTTVLQASPAARSAAERGPVTPAPQRPPVTTACITDECRRACAELARTAAGLRASLPRPLVFTNGVFDLLHAGHVACLEEARRLGASLVVGINSDASARRLRKGLGRPINSAADRARVVAALATVSAVVLFEEDKPLALICGLRPDIYVKGGDYTPDSLPEAALMAEWGGQTVIVPRVPDRSSSGLIERAAAVWRLAQAGDAHRGAG